MKRWAGIFCMIVLLGIVSTGLALDPLLVGNFEDGSVSYSSTDIRWDNWMINLDSSATTIPIQAATLGSHSLKWVTVAGGWGGNTTKPLFEYGTDPATNPYLEILLNEGAVIAVDITAVSSEVADGFCSVVLHWNASGGWGTDEGWQDVIVDGQPHTYVFEITEAAKTVLEDSIDAGGWCNLGFLINTGSGSTTLYLDNIWFFPDGLVNTYGPYGATAEQDFNAGDPDYVDFMLYWKAGKDPGGREPDPNFAYPVNPDIVDEYIFRTNGSESDPNLYYLGATGVDPGLYDPNSEYGPVVLPINSMYSWTVVEAMDGYEQTFTVGVSTLENVDPNNIIGPKWTFATLSTLPVIDTQPVSKRFGVGDVDAQFTIAVTSNTTPSYQWFYSLDAVIDAGDNAISAVLGGDTDTLTITSHNKAYQAYYYCRVANASTISGGLGGTEDDVYSDIVSLVVERKVAEYLFDGTLTDSSGEGNNGTSVGSPAFVTGVGGSGSALSLDGSTQYVEFGSSADPNTFNKCFPRADLLAEKGIGGGLDAGTIMCWVKLDATAADQVSPIMQNGNGGWPATVFEFVIPTDAAAENTNLRTSLWGDDEVLTMIDVNPEWSDPFNMGGDSQWHMLASAWDRNAGTMKAYLDGNLLATWGADPSVFSAWDSTMMIGSDGTNYFGGLIDNLKIYNYEVAAEEIVQEYYAVTGGSGCIYLDFSGSSLNADNTGGSYCKIDLADFAVLAENWLNDGFYTPVP